MSSPADRIRQLLIDLELGSASGTWPVFVSFLPAEPDNAICIYDTTGRLGGRLMENGLQIEHSGIQIRVRGDVYPDTWNKANAIAIALDQQIRRSIAISGENSYILHNASRTGSIIPLGLDPEDQRRRFHFTINTLLTISQQQ
jgi:hypothetical protein